jgi:multiple sugar transport system substrate-binding protein
MKRVLFAAVTFILLLSLVSCATPTPQVIKETVVVTEKETVVVEKESTVVVKETVPVPQERTKVVLWHIFGSGASRDVFDQIISEFNLTNPNYIVEPVFKDFWTYEQNLLAAIAAGEPPDVVMTDQTRAGQRAEADQIIPLDAYIDADGFDMSVFFDYPLKDVVYKGETWGIPFGPDTRILYYNKDFFEEVGLDPAVPPETWDDLWDYALKLDIGEGASLERVGFNPWWGNVWVMPLVWSNGATMVDETGTFTLNAPEVVETAAWYKQWVDHYGKEELDIFASGFGTGAQDPFMSGQVAMIIQTQGYIGQLQTYAPDLNWGAALIPYNATPASWGAGFDLEIPKGAPNPDGAWEFIKYLTSKDIQVQFAKASGWMPSRVEAAEDPIVADVPGWDVVLESMAVTKSRRFVLEAPTWYGFVTTAFQEVWEGDNTPQEALDDAQAAVEQEVANYKATHE